MGRTREVILYGRTSTDFASRDHTNEFRSRSWNRLECWGVGQVFNLSRIFLDRLKICPTYESKIQKSGADLLIITDTNSSMKRELYLLSPHTYPGQNPTQLSDEEMLAWMNAYTALWHPAVIWGSSGPPKVDPPHDHEEPEAQNVYAVPGFPPNTMPEGWADKVKEVGGVAVRASRDRKATLQGLHETMGQVAPVSFEMSDLPTEGGEQLSPEEIRNRLLALEPEKVRQFFGIGLGYLLLVTLSKAMEHESLLVEAEFWDEIQMAIAVSIGLVKPPEGPDSDIGMSQEGEQYAGEPDSIPPEAPPQDSYPDDPYQDPGYNDPYDDDRGEYDGYYDDMGPGGVQYTVDPNTLEPWQRHLYNAAQRLYEARETLYQANIFLIDVCSLDEKHFERQWPGTLERGLPLNVVASSSTLEKFKEVRREDFERFRELAQDEILEICGGCYVDREDAVLPVESQLWNVRKGTAVYQELLGKPVEIFARQRSFVTPQLPLFLSSHGITRAVMLPNAGTTIPHFMSAVVHWPSPDGKQVDAFVRAPLRAHSAHTFFHLGYYLFKTTREDHAATLPIFHREPANPWTCEFLELYRCGPIFGEWVTYRRYFNEMVYGEHPDLHNVDEYDVDYLTSRTAEGEHHTPPKSKYPITGFNLHQRIRRRLDVCWSLAAMQRGLAGKNDPLDLNDELQKLEDAIEMAGPDFTEPVAQWKEQLDHLEKRILETMSEKLLSQATTNEPGYLFINPCSYARRITVESSGVSRALPIKDTVKACQLDGDKQKLVLEIPSLGFAWIPKNGPQDAPPPTMRMRLADELHVRNEFFEAEVDPKTGGLRAIAARKAPINRLSQQLIFNPEKKATMRVSNIKTTSEGPALGEVISEGAIVGEQEQVLARYRQRLRAWLGRPVLEMRIELFPEQPAAGDPWHAFYGCRFAWGDERTAMFRGVNGTGYLTMAKRPQTPDFIELRAHQLNTVIFPCGLPFLQRHGGRMLDLILLPQRESVHTYDIAIGLDRAHPMLTAQGLTTPVSMIETTKGPPHIGSEGWLYHLDTPNLLLTSMRPGGVEISGEAVSSTNGETPNLHNAMTVRLMEVSLQSGIAEFRCVRNPKHAALLDLRGERLLETTIENDSCHLEVTPGDFNQLQVEFN